MLRSGQPVYLWTHGNRLHARLSQVAAYGLENLIPTHIEAKEQAKALNEIEYGSAQTTLKNLAFSVEMDRQGNIVAPSQRGEQQARSEILGLEYFLEKFALLPDALQIVIDVGFRE